MFRIAPLPVRLWPGKIREPNLFFIAKEHTDRIGEQACGVPDLVVEVTSPSTARVDRVEEIVSPAIV
ncbi:Uma2 family endonuclease [Thermoflexus sp.]|uniref:Uma2 family endonuclease n=1 Tax=Thermoflexus sp. TaxID=1969742 RepID=UPI0025D02AC6|nr:Uma2 family endonuclease [Thermoflexus sp.]MCS6964593.1 Uma2 family endonuclease [Thermoflexus sp.]MCX7690971.1 Uma2 family endonuclease [Thermoflexus sp.]MDW8184113.1 Uma2 family endonuclease [Anaerolineae bacterium]